VRAYSPALLRKFDRLTAKLSSRDQMARIEARMDITGFIALHGRAVCNEMFEVLQRRDRRRK